MLSSLSAWWLLLLAVPVLLAGEALVRRFAVLGRFNLPVPVVGGLLFSAGVLALNASGLAAVAFQTKVAAAWWTWLVTPEAEWIARPAKNLNLPLLVAFFTCIGLGAPVSVLRTGGRALAILLGSAAVLLPLFLAVTLAALNLGELAPVAGPMVVILVVNTLVSLAFAAFVVWPLLGRDHEAGVMVAGLVGFGVGSTATAVAAMDAIVRRRGPAPRAFALVPPTGGFLIDLINAPVITAFIRLLR